MQAMQAFCPLGINVRKYQSPEIPKQTFAIYKGTPSHPKQTNTITTIRTIKWIRKEVTLRIFLKSVMHFLGLLIHNGHSIIRKLPIITTQLVPKNARTNPTINPIAPKINVK